MDDQIPLKVEFSGGLEMLFSNLREHKVTIPALDGEKKPSNVAFLIKYLCDNVMDDPRKEMFVQNESVRPGVLVLINDADWELEGEANYELQPYDNIMFVSTLHGG